MSEIPVHTGVLFKKGSRAPTGHGIFGIESPPWVMDRSKWQTCSHAATHADTLRYTVLVDFPGSNEPQVRGRRREPDHAPLLHLPPRPVRHVRRQRALLRLPLPSQLHHRALLHLQHRRIPLLPCRHGQARHRCTPGSSFIFIYVMLSVYTQISLQGYLAWVNIAGIDVAERRAMKDK